MVLFDAHRQRRHASRTASVHDFLRAYYHHKSADWTDNKPYPLNSWSAGELAKLPTYYVMDLNETMAETVAKEMPSPAAIAANQWLPDNELAYYSAEYGRTGFQGGLQWYRCGTSAAFNNELQLFAGRSIDVPSCFISGKQDWGTYQRPGVFEAMQKSACTRMLGCPSRRRCRPLGAAGAAGRGEPLAARLPRQDLLNKARAG
jgi:hypothetical protein